MAKDIRPFEVKHEDERFIFGQLSGEHPSGGYLNAAYLLTLSNVLEAAKIRMGSLQGKPVPDSVASLFTSLDELCKSHQKVLAQEAEEIKAAMESLRGYTGDGNDDGPKRA